MAATERPFLRAAVLMSFAVGALGCTDEIPPEGEGLVIEDAGADLGLGTSSNPATGDGTGQAGDGSDLPGDDGVGAAGTDGTGAATGRSCSQVSAFTANAGPLFLADCVRCHNGTKGKATQLLDLTTLADASAAGQQTACDNTLSTTDESQLENSTIFTFLDPDNAATAHDFKYPSAAEFTAYRDAVLQWLALE